MSKDTLGTFSFKYPTSFVIFAFAGAFIGQIINAICLVAAQAVSLIHLRNGSSISIFGYLADHWSDLIQEMYPRLATIIVVAACFIAAMRFMNMLHKAFIFGILLICVGAGWDIYPRMSVIPLSWSVIYGGSFYFFMVVDRFSRFGKLKKPLKTMVTNKSIDLIVQTIVVLGTTLGVCMSILWMMDPQNLQFINFPPGPKESNYNYDVINSYRGLWAAYMMVHFGFLCMTMALWICPYIF